MMGRAMIPLMKKYIFMAALFLSLSTLPACYGVNVPQSDYARPQSMPLDARPAPVRLSKVVMAIPRGETIASVSPRGVGLLCGGSYGMVPRSKIVNDFDDADFKDLFKDTMQAQGYDVSDNSAIMFDAELEEMRSKYLVAARVVDIKMDLCERRTFWLSHDLGFQGESSMVVEWSLYDRMKRVTVLKTTTRGYSRMDLPNYEGIALLVNDSFAGAVHNLGADPAFFDLVVNGRKPAPGETADQRFGPAGPFDPAEAVIIPRAPLSTIPASPERLNILRQAAVVVSAGKGHGSGFFIGHQGHIMTTFDVVGEADQVRIVTHDKKLKLVGQVLRRDRQRNVALIRVSLPENFKPVVLPIRDDLPQIGEEVYTIGAVTQAKDLQSTVTKGLMSVYRPRDVPAKLPMFEVDITAHVGNAGGMLLDQRGNLIGLRNGGGPLLDDDIAPSISQGLKKFIPINTTLDRLGIAIAD